MTLIYNRSSADASAQFLLDSVFQDLVASKPVVVVMSDTVFPDAESKRHELVAMLTAALEGRPDFVKKHRKVKTYVLRR